MKYHARMLRSLTLILPLIGHAQGRPPVTEEWSISAGAGLMVAPNYTGDNEYRLSAVPSIRISYGDRFSASVENGIRYTVINSEGFSAGPVIKYHFGRKEDGEKFMALGDDSDDLRGLGDVDGTAELGIFAAYRHEKISTKIELRQGLGGHEGFISDANLQYNNTLQMGDQRLIYAFGPTLRLTDGQYNDRFFGVNAAQSAASGLATYNADSASLSCGFSGKIIIPHTDNLSTLLLAQYTRLGNTIADSSLVTERGDPDQLMLGCFVSYQF
jgi:outer membrane scaffolding protein for murein synthesis (MipA/OmpV family)